jgi:hypothetical protein
MGFLTHRRSAAALCVVALGLFASSCSLGEGTGFVHSDRLQAKECTDHPYDLRPTFFGSNPFLGTQTIRLQHGEDIEENSDGVLILVDDTAYIRAHLGEALPVMMPPGVTPPGVPIVAQSDPAKVHMTLYLHNTCHGLNIALYAVSGTITFDKIFSGNRTEDKAEERLSEAHFDVMVADPRDQPPGGGAVDPDKMSHLVGEFRFFFERGQPAQPFP